LIPFNYLGFIFKHFGKRIYPECARSYLEGCIEKLNKDSAVLDLGGGTGVLTEIAYGFNPSPQYIVSDPSIGMLKHSPNFSQKVLSKAENLPFKDESFDCVMIGEALHHFKNIDKSLNEIHRVLKHNGTLFIFDFDPKVFKGKMIYLFEKMLGEPVNFFQPSELSEILQEKGFVINFHKKEYKYVLLGTKIIENNN